MNIRVKSLKKIIDISRACREQGEKVGLITGSFDIIHPGHVHLLQQARANCDLLILGVENDGNIRRVKGNFRPIHTQDQRIEVLAECRSVDYIFKIENEFTVFNEEAEKYYTDLLLEIKPAYLFTTITTDAHFERKKTKAEAAGVLLVGIELKHNTSTTILADKIQKEQ